MSSPSSAARAPILARAYAPADRDACLALFDGNVPRFFDAGERSDFERFLGGTALASPYQLLLREGRIVACGGFLIETGEEAHLCWGMVDRALQGQGLGARLTEARLAAARATPGVRRVRLDTSQHTQSFYARFGFQVVSVTPDGYGPGLDRWDMVLDL